MAKLHFCTKLTSILVIGIGLYLLSITKIHAQEYEINNQDIEIDLFGDGSAYFKDVFTITNSSEDNLIAGYSYVLPAREVVSPILSYGEKLVPIAAYSDPEKNFSTLEIDFGEDAIKPQESRNITINTQIENFVSSKLGIKYLLMQPNFENAVSFNINYPAEFGEPLYISDRNAEIQTTNNNINTISLSNKDLILIMWGNEYYIDVSLNSQLTNRSSEEVKTFFQIIPEYDSQQTVYKNMNNAEFGLIDEYNNFYAALTLLPGETQNVGFEARVKKTGQELAKQTDAKYNFEVSEDNTLFQDLKNRTNSEINPKENLEEIYDYLVKEYPLEFTQTNREKINDGFLEEIAKKERFNSFDFTYLLAAYAESLDFETEIQYGYVILKPDDEKIVQPHFWLTVFNEEESFIIDPYMEITTQLHYFDFQSGFDRLTMGVWYPDQEYNDVLGLLTSSDGGGVKKIEIIDDATFDNPNSGLNISSPNTPTRLSGFYYNQEIFIENTSASVINIQDVLVNGNRLDIPNFLNNMQYILLPHTNNVIQLPSVKDTNFFYEGEKSENVIVSTDSAINPELSVNYTVRYTRDTKFMVFIIIVLLIIILVLWIVFKRTWKNIKLKRKLF